MGTILSYIYKDADTCGEEKVHLQTKGVPDETADHKEKTSLHKTKKKITREILQNMSLSLKKIR
jgi:hypothetical protein